MADFTQNSLLYTGHNFKNSLFLDSIYKQVSIDLDRSFLTRVLEHYLLNTNYFGILYK